MNILAPTMWLLGLSLFVAMTTVAPQLQLLQIPNGALVEVEVEFVNQQPGTGGMMAPGNGGVMTPLNMMTSPNMMSPPNMMMSPRITMPPPMMGAPGSGIERLLNNMFQVALNLRRTFRPTDPLPPMEEPCPCDGECCATPAEPRRVLPVFNIPMTMHPGCCGCVECPLALSPDVALMLQTVQTMIAPASGAQNGAGAMSSQPGMQPAA
ncbi:uncharacterized protein LOC127881874 isoform X2 [Dreissena polymorpha]|nr:uncharacterized protein LOC127881874 isoform X2 [Dreissena polymorpha]